MAKSNKINALTSTEKLIIEFNICRLLQTKGICEETLLLIEETAVFLNTPSVEEVEKSI